MWITPVTDRTRADVDYARLNRNSPESLKGMRNYTDLQRIANNLRYLRDVLMGYGYTVPELTCRDDWGVGDVPRRADIEKFKADVSAIRATGFIAEDTPQVPDLPYLHYQKLNDIERILLDAIEAIARLEADFLYCGECYAGDDRDDQHFEEVPF